MTDFDELRRQLRIAYGLVIERARRDRWPVMSAFAAACGMKTNSYRRIELGERAITAPELEVIAHVLGLSPTTIRAEAIAMVEGGEIPSHAGQAAESWRRALNPKRSS